MMGATYERAHDVFALPEGLRVIVTAGASGIGRAIADLLIARGGRLHICDVSDEFLADFPQLRIPHAGRRKPTSPQRPTSQRLFAEAQASLGGLDALINNAGIAGPTGGVEEIAPADWRRTLDVCLTGQFLCAHLATPAVESGRRRRDRQHVLAGRPIRLCLPHRLFRREMRRHRLHPESRQGAWTLEHSRERHPSGYRRGTADDRRHRRAGEANQHDIRRDGARLSRPRVAEAHGDGRRRRGDGRLSSFAGRT